MVDWVRSAGGAGLLLSSVAGAQFDEPSDEHYRIDAERARIEAQVQSLEDRIHSLERESATSADVQMSLAGFDLRPLDPRAQPVRSEAEEQELVGRLMADVPTYVADGRSLTPEPLPQEESVGSAVPSLIVMAGAGAALLAAVFHLQRRKARRR